MAWSDYVWPSTWLSGVKLGDHLTNPTDGTAPVVRAKREVEQAIVRSFGVHYLGRSDTTYGIDYMDWLDTLQGQFATDAKLKAMVDDLWGWKWIEGQVEDVNLERARQVRRHFDDVLDAFMAYAPEKLRILTTGAVADTTEVFVV